MIESEKIQVEMQPYDKAKFDSKVDLDQIIYDLNSQIDLLSSKADRLDYLVSIGSGVLSGLLDILWVGEFNLERGRNIAGEEINDFVIRTAKLLGCKNDDLTSAVKFLEKTFPIPSDGNTPQFGGGLQHHLRDFAHHPTIAGLMFSLMTQFTHKAYGTDISGNFLTVDITEKSSLFIGEDIPSKIFKGTITWFFHLVSDVAGSSGSASTTGGTGIPGPLLALAKELSVLDIFKNINIGDHSLHEFLSKLFNGTLLAKRDESNNIIKNSELRFDLRGELGVGIEIGRQSLPVIANECIVRSFYFIRRLALEIKENEVRTFSELKEIDWEKVKPLNNPTMSRMLTVATGVFTTIDVSEAFVTQKYWVAINYPGVGRFAVAIGEDVSWCLKTRRIKKIKNMYETIQRATFDHSDNNLFDRIGADMNTENLGLTVEQIEILYNLEYYKTLNDIRMTKTPVGTEKVKQLKHIWLREWKNFISKGFSSFLQIENAEIQWLTVEELVQKIEENQPDNTWFRLVLLEAMLFEPYFPMEVEKDKSGNDKPSKKYKSLNNAINGYNKAHGDHFIDMLFSESYYPKGYIKRLRKSYNRVLLELNEVLKSVIKTLSITSVITIMTVATAGAFAPTIATILVGSSFSGLNGAALTSASLAYLGGGAVAAGGAGMAGGTFAIVGGGAILGAGMGAGVGGAVGAAGLRGKQQTILQSAKLLVSIREIFLNDEHDIAYSKSVYEQYAQKIIEIEKGLVELRAQSDEATGDKKKQLQRKIKKAEESIEAMKVAKNNLRKFMSSFEVGSNQE